MKLFFFFFVCILGAMQQNNECTHKNTLQVPSLLEIARDRVLDYLTTGELSSSWVQNTSTQDVYEILKKHVRIYRIMQSGFEFNAIASKEQLKNLFALDIDINTPATSGWTFLHAAVCDGNIEVITYLLENGAKTSVRNAAGKTPLHIACIRGDTKIIKLLLEHKANVNAQGSVYKQVPLHILVTANNQKTIKNIEVLLNAGAKLTVKDNIGNTPIDYATSQKIRELLENHSKKSESH